MTTPQPPHARDTPDTPDIPDSPELPAAPDPEDRVPPTSEPADAPPPSAGPAGGFGPPVPPSAPGAPLPPPAPPGGFGAPVPPPARTPPAQHPPTPHAPPPAASATPPPSATDAAPSGAAQPGYAYPQPAGCGYPAAVPQQAQPLQPPQPPQGYGYPAPTPHPHAYGYPAPTPQPHLQQPPYGAPGYGYPGQLTVPLQPAAVTRGRKVDAQLAIIVSAVVAIALIIGGGVWYSKSSRGGGNQADPTSSASPSASGGAEGGGGGGGGRGAAAGTEKAPADPSAKALFQLPMPTVAKDDSVAVDGSWLTDRAFVKTRVAEIVGYDRDKGTKLWTVKLPGPVCAASRRTNDDNRTAIVFQPKTPAKNSTAGCTQISALDLNAGRQLWTKTVSSGDAPLDFDNVTVSADTLAVASSDGGAAFDIPTGRLLWKPKASDTCFDAGYGGGAKLVAVRKCGSYDARQLHIQTIDPASGKVLSEYRLATDIEYAAVVSTDPLVVAADVGDSAGDGSGISDFFSIDNATGELRTRISAPGGDYAAECDSIYEVEACQGLVVGNDRLYIATEEHDTGDGGVNEVVAFDLATGRQTGQRLDSGPSYTLYPLRMDGANLIVYKEPSYGEGGKVVSVDGGSFKETELLENTGSAADKEMESDMSPKYSEILYSRGRLYLSEKYVDSSDTGDDKHLAIAFGTTG